VSDQRGEHQYRRIGETAKCPACGWRMDSEAYRCPKCYIYFCFKCRVRVTEREQQFQCADQSCPCYGKLLCAVCTVMVPEFKDVARTEHDTVPDQPETTVKVGDWGVEVFLLVPVVGIALWLKFSLPVAIAGAVATSVVIAIILYMAGSTLIMREKVIPATTRRVPRTVTENMQVSEHRCCIQCKHPTKALR
jgi:hypothetical protein